MKLESDRIIVHDITVTKLSDVVRNCGQVCDQTAVQQDQNLRFNCQGLHVDDIPTVKRFSKLGNRVQQVKVKLLDVARNWWNNLLCWNAERKNAVRGMQNTSPSVGGSVGNSQPTEGVAPKPGAASGPEPGQEGQ